MNRNSHDLRWTYLPRDAMHKRGLCCHAVSVRLSVCLPRSWVASKRKKISSKIFHHWVAKPCTSKSDAAVIGNKKLRCRYVEADYRQTRRIAHKRGYSRHEVSVCHVRGSCQNSTQREFTDTGETPHCPHLFIKINYKTIRHILLVLIYLQRINITSNFSLLGLATPNIV